MKEMGVVRKVPIQWGGMHPVFEAVLLLKHTQSILSGMRKYFLIIIAYMTKMMIHQRNSRHIVKQQDMFGGIGSWDPHMMAYHKQLKDFTTMYDKETILYEGMRI